MAKKKAKKKASPAKKKSPKKAVKKAPRKKSAKKPAKKMMAGKAKAKAKAKPKAKRPARKSKPRAASMPVVIAATVISEQEVLDSPVNPPMVEAPIMDEPEEPTTPIWEPEEEEIDDGEI